MKVPIANHPPSILNVVFRTLPKILLDEPLLPDTGRHQVSIQITMGPSFVSRSRELKRFGSSGVMSAPFRIDTTMKSIAKIAHSYSVAEVGLQQVDWFLPKLILGKAGDYGNYIGNKLIADSKSKDLHTISLRWSDEFLVVDVRLYARFGTPTYVVVSGRRRP